MTIKTLFALVCFLVHASSYASLVLCLDGGGTKTLVSLLKEGRPCLLRTCSYDTTRSRFIRLGPCNTPAGVREGALVEDVFRLEFLDDTCDAWVPLREVAHQLFVVAGFAGGGSKAKQALWAKHFENQGILPYNIHIDSDVGLALDTLDAPAIVLIAGTGSVCFGKVDDSGPTVIRAGGLGWFLGDEGSGFDIGKQAIRAALEEHRPDVQRQIPFVERIFERLTDTFGAAAISVLHAHILAGRFLPTQIAAFAPTVFDLASDGDEHACAILDQAAEALSRLLAQVLNQMHTRAEVRVCLIGGLFKNEDFRELVIAKSMLHAASMMQSINWDTSYLNGNPAETWALLYQGDLAGADH